MPLALQFARALRPTVRPWSLVALLLLTTAASGQIAFGSAQDILPAGRVVLGFQNDPFQRLMDLDGNAYPDLLGTKPGSNFTRFTIYRDFGNPSAVTLHSGTFTSAHGVPTHEDPVVVGDFDGDGRRDDFVLAAGSHLAMFQMLLMNGPSQVVQAQLPFPVRGLLAKDLNGDAADDVIVVTDQNLIVSLSPHTSATYLSLTGLTRPTALGQGVLRHASGAHTLIAFDQRVRYEQGALSIQPALPGLVVAGPVLVGDIDGDGDEDAVISSADGRYQVIRQGPSGALLVEAVAEGGPATDLYDVDGDGDLDGACCGGGSGGPVPNLTFDSFQVSHFEFSENDGTGRFAKARRFRGYGAVRLAAVVDVDQDGHKDWVAGRTIVYGRGDSPFTRHTSEPLPASVSAVAAGDLDGDGDIEPIFESIHQVGNDGRGEQRKRAPVFVGPPPPASFNGRLVYGDWDGDGDQDAIAPLSPMAWLAENQGGGDYRWIPGGVTLSGAPQSFDFEGMSLDLDGDGLDDRIGTDPNLANYASYVSWNDGQGQFSAGPSWNNQRVVGTGDFDGNGRLDLLVARFTFAGSRHYGTLVILRQVSHRTFAVTLIPSADSNEGAPLVVDFDGDGDLDIVRSNWLSSRHQLLRNTGAATFVEETLILGTVNQGGRQAYAFVDLDGDGQRELLASPALNAPEATIVLKHDPVHGWQSAGTFAFTPDFVADLDADGDVDLIDRNAGLMIENLARTGPATSERHQTGVAIGDALGFTPKLGATGSFAPLGTTVIHLCGAPGGALAFLVVGGASTDLPGYPLPGLRTYVDPFAPTSWIYPAFNLDGPVGLPGAGSAEFSVALPAGIGGLDVHHQAFFFDPMTQSWTATQALRIRYGF